MDGDFLIEIWIIEKVIYQQTLFDQRPIHGYTLVDGDYHPLCDEQGCEYFCSSMAEAEAKLRERITPVVNRLLARIE